MSPLAQADVTGSIDLSRPGEVAHAIEALLGARYGGDWNGGVLAKAVRDTSAAYAGDYGGFLPCDTPYHDLRHALDVALATARLIDGWERANAGHPESLGPTLAEVGVILALLHDVGFLRHPEEDVTHGAALTAEHEARSAAFAARYLAGTAIAAYAPLSQLIGGTRLGMSPDQFAGPDPRHRTLGRMIATADLVSQLADRYYLEKCRDFLYEEFVHAGFARGADGSNPEAAYESPEDLLGKTTGFWRRHVLARLDAELGGLHRCFATHFGGHDPYRAAIERNMAFLGKLLDDGDFTRLKRRPKPVFGGN